MRAAVLIALLFILQNGRAQSHYTESKIKLSKELREISGIETMGDSLLVAINDGGNEPVVFFLNLKGTILHRSVIMGIRNHDWEDLTSDDKGNLYIGDVGDNLSTRKNRFIYKIQLIDAYQRDSVQAEIISFNYSSEKISETDTSYNGFDCETIFWKQNQLYLIIKNRTKPWNGLAAVYKLSDKTGKQTAEPFSNLLSGNNSWYKDAITSGDELNDTLYLLTYSRMILCTFPDDHITMNSEYRFKKLNQKECIAVARESIFVAAERHWLLGGPYLYTLEFK